MKKTILFAAVAIGTLLFPACNEKEQSEMTMDSIQGRATIQGQVMYNQGDIQEDGVVLEGINMTPAKEVAVMVKVPYSSYKDDAADGDAVYTVKTDANGNYAVEIPVGARDVQATVSVLPFYASYGEYTNGTINIVEDALFNEGESVVYVGQNDVKIANLEVQPAEINTQPERNQTITIKGEVAYWGEVREVGDYEEVFYVRGKISCPNQPVRISLVKGDNKIIYNTTTDSNGEFNLDAKFYDDWSFSSDFKVLAEVKASFVEEDSDRAFRHYVKSAETNEWMTAQRLSGAFSGAFYEDYVASENEFLPLSIELEQEFTPEDFSIIRGIGNRDVDYEDGKQIFLMNYDDPMGWNIY